MIGPHDSAPHIPFHHGILDCDERAVVARGIRSHGIGVSVPLDLVWRKILIAPDTSLLTVYQGGQRTGFAEFSTSVEQAMAALDEDNPPPEGIVARAGYQVRFDGNVSVGACTNRFNFDGRIQFSPRRNWRELNLKLSAHGAAVEIHSAATNQTVHLKITGEGAVIERDFTFADLQNSDTLLRSFAGDFGGGLLGELDLPPFRRTSATLTGSLHWEAHHDRLMVGREPYQPIVWKRGCSTIRSSFMSARWVKFCAWNCRGT